MSLETDSKFEIDVSFKCADWPAAFEPMAVRAVRAALDCALPTLLCGEVSIVLADDAFVRALNKDYRGKDAVTNVLSFPQMEKAEFDELPELASLGDIVLAYGRVETEAMAHKKSFEDHGVHLVVHGLLHLLGYDHEDKGEAEAEAMESLEVHILDILGIKNPYESMAGVA